MSSHLGSTRQRIYFYSIVNGSFVSFLEHFGESKSCFDLCISDASDDDQINSRKHKNLLLDN